MAQVPHVCNQANRAPKDGPLYQALTRVTDSSRAAMPRGATGPKAQGSVHPPLAVQVAEDVVAQLLLRRGGVAP